MSFALEDARVEFLDETEEMIERISLNLSCVEKGESSDETLKEIYRDMHTIKGSSQLFGCEKLGNLTHALEAALDPIRNKQLAFETELMDLTYQGLDIVKTIVAELRDSGNEPDVTLQIDELIIKLTDVTSRLLGGSLSLVADSVGVVAKEVIPKEEAQVKATAPKSIAESAAVGNAASNQVKSIPVMPLTSDLAKEPPGQKASPVVAATLAPEKPTATNPVSPAKAKSEVEKASETIRVQVSLLDNLMNMIGELVLIRNQVLQHANESKESSFTNLSQRLNIVTTELQDEVMKTRMQPVGNVLTKFHRVVRDLSRELNKDIELVLSGAETELDKTLLEAVKDPLTHIVRNSVDHGLELPDEREATGKPRKGTINIRSYHEGGQVIIEIADDGKGLNAATLGPKAVEKGVITKAQLAALSERDIHKLIFAAGFSTTDKVSNISGRGVGMDVVRSNLEKIGGTIDLNSVLGKGTTLRLKIPLTLAIVPALIVTESNKRFAIPQVKLVELVRAQKNNPEHKIEDLQGKPVFRLRGELLPLVSLKDILQTEELSKKTPKNVEADGGEAGILSTAVDEETTNIAVLNSDKGWFGLIVDTIEDSTDIVVKPLSSFLKSLSVFSGATVMGDGSLALTLDVLGIANHVQAAGHSSEDSPEANRAVRLDSSVEEVEYLIIDIGNPGKFAMPLCIVNRLEEFKKVNIEKAGAKRVVRYRDGILPLINIRNELGLELATKEAGESDESETIPVVVFERNGKFFGLEVNKILDVITIPSNIDSSSSDRAGIVGGLVNNEEILTVLDPIGILDKVFGVQASGRAHEVSTDLKTQDLNARRSKHRILLAEDNSFFRKQVSHILTQAGYQVASTIDGEKALVELKARGKDHYSLLLSDIEMPVMTGIELARAVRQEAEYGKEFFPMIALTTKNSEKDRKIGFEAGFNNYLEKLKGDVLIKQLDETLGVIDKGGV